jgi:hypothetical protein
MSRIVALGPGRREPRLHPTDPSRNIGGGPEALCPGVEAPPWLPQARRAPSGPPTDTRRARGWFSCGRKVAEDKTGIGWSRLESRGRADPCPQMGRREYPKPSASATAPSCHAAKSPAVNMGVTAVHREEVGAVVALVDTEGVDLGAGGASSLATPGCRSPLPAAPSSCALSSQRRRRAAAIVVPGEGFDAQRHC